MIPTYNRGHIIGRAIQSALGQTLPPAEVIVVDDGSGDDTQERVAAFGGPVCYLYQPNAGSAVARHRGMVAARHEWVALLDSDDYWSTTHLERTAVAIQTTQGQATFYFADTIQPLEKGGGSRWQALQFATEGAFTLIKDGTPYVMMRPQPMMLQSSVFSRAAYMASGGFLPRLRYRDDTHLFLKLGLSRPIGAVTGIGAYMTSDDHPANRLSLTYDHQKSRDGYQMQVWMFEDLLAHLPALPSPARSELQRRLAEAYRGLARSAWRHRQWESMVRHTVSYALVQTQRCWADLAGPMTTTAPAKVKSSPLMHIILFHFYSRQPNPVYQEIAAALRRRGHAVWIGQPDRQGDLEWHNGDRVVARQPGPQPVPAGLRRVKPLAALMGYINYGWFVWQVRRFLAKSAPDIVQVNLNRLAWLLPLLSPSSIRYVYDIRQINEEVSGTLWGRLRERLAVGALIANASFFYEQTAFCHAGAAHRILGEGWRRRGAVVPVGIDEAFLNTPSATCAGAIPDAKVRFVYAGTLSRLRNLEQLLRASRRVLAVSDQFQVDLIGPDTANGYYQRCIAELGIGAVVALLPPVHYTQIPGLLRTYDVGLAYVPDRPTWHYQPTIKVLEYRALGLPILSTDVASHREVVEHGINGLLVADTEEALAAGLERFICDRPFLEQVCQAAPRDAPWIDVGRSSAWL